MNAAPPAAPRPGAETLRCRCGAILAVACERWLFFRHRGRTVEAALPARVLCDRCNTSTLIPLRSPVSEE